MSALPEQYRRYAQPEQRPLHGPVELYGERDPIVWVPDAHGEMVRMRRSQLPAYTPPPPPRDLTPQPLLDPLAQRFVGAGVGLGAAGAGVGYGAGQMFAGIAMMGTSGLAILLGLLLAAGSMRGRGVTHVQQEVHQHAGWFGKNTTTM